jgi:hypothetical protein
MERKYRLLALVTAAAITAGSITSCVVPIDSTAAPPASPPAADISLPTCRPTHVDLDGDGSTETIFYLNAPQQATNVTVNAAPVTHQGSPGSTINYDLNDHRYSVTFLANYSDSSCNLIWLAVTPLSR